MSYSHICSTYQIKQGMAIELLFLIPQSFAAAAFFAAARAFFFSSSFRLASRRRCSTWCFTTLSGHEKRLRLITSNLDLDPKQPDLFLALFITAL